MAKHDAFKSAVESMDVDAMKACFTPDATFHSPAVFKPYEGRDAVMFVLTAVTQVFEDFRYLDELDGDGTSALIFEATVGDMQLQGLDHLTYDADGLITNLTVMVRPFNGLRTLLEHMGAKLAANAG